MVVRKIPSTLREMVSEEAVCIEFGSSSSSVRQMVKDIGALRTVKKGTRFETHAGRILALDVPTKNIRPYESQLLQLAQNVETRLRYRGCMLPLKYANKRDLDEFLTHPEAITFVASKLLVQGIQFCLENGIALTASSDRLVSSQPQDAVFPTYTALEELGKAALLVDSLKQSPPSAEFVKVEGFRHHTTKLLRVVEGLAGETVRINKHRTEIRDGALKTLNRAAKSCVGNNGAIAFQFLYRELVKSFEFFRNMGEFFRESAIYVEYNTVNNSWTKPSTRFSTQEIRNLNETIREYCEEYKTKIDPTNISNIPRLEDVVPTAWFDRLSSRWPPRGQV